MRIHVIRHISFEGPGAIAEWAAERGHSLSESDLAKGQSLPSLDAFDLLVLMGGPMSVNDEADFAWLMPEKALVREALAVGKKVLGVCLGAQMIASALGKRVYPNPVKEIGWFPLQATDEGRQHPWAQGLPAELLVLHWHGETYDLPDGATLLYRSEACENQAYAIGANALALQCHVEVTADSLKAMAEGCKNELLARGPYVQSYEEILDRQDRVEDLRAVLSVLLDRFSSSQLFGSGSG